MDYINQIEPVIGEEEISHITEYLRNGGWLTEFKKTEEFEKRISEFLGVKYTVVVPSGTVGLYLALLALGIGNNDSVLVPDYTMVASPNSVKWAGAEVILVDVEKDNLCMDIDKIVLNPNTRALMYVAINGRSGNMNAIIDFCKKNNLFLIEDSCQAFGSKYNNQFLGTFGDVGVFSFTPHKIITTGQGGAVVTNNENLYQKIKSLKDFCRTKPGVDIHTDIGFNFKFTDIQATIGIEQIKKINDRINSKKKMYDIYRNELCNCNYIEFLPIDLNYQVPWFIDVILKGVEQSKMVDYLKENKIGSRPFYPPIHTQKPYYYLNNNDSFPVISEISPNGLWLPSTPNLSYKIVKYIIKTLKNYLN